jgi:hypothetical protein
VYVHHPQQPKTAYCSRRAIRCSNPRFSGAGFREVSAKRFNEQVRHAADTFVREHLPPQAVGLLAPELPELLPGLFVEEGLGQHHSDLLFGSG